MTLVKPINSHNFHNTQSMWDIAVKPFVRYALISKAVVSKEKKRMIQAYIGI